MEPERPLVCLLRTGVEGDPYQAALEAAGYRVVSQPVLTFRWVDPEALSAALGASHRWGGLILTSPRAAEALARVWTDAHARAWRGRTVFAVGPRTADGARALGLAPEGEEAGEAHALAERIAGRPFAAPLLFLCGDRRRDELPRALAAAGIAVREQVVYETRLRTGFALDPWPDWLVFFSPSGVEAVQQNVLIDPRRARCAAIGPTTAAALRAAGWPPAAVAPAPTPEGLVTSLQAAACM
ncbi:MAG: uroporphyrinogen-III synthase [Rhodothermales bacterium]|nr:uroporphyrinogen-III synthase [Rhodothermales bacterium]